MSYIDAGRKNVRYFLFLLFP
uniref:Uncharacterized protein n=1 Tax=Arundo donax TaxID=35708 RepID=A0A0A9AL09_ARUDO